MEVYDTGGGTLTHRSIHFFRGSYDFGDGLYIYNAKVVVELSFFSDCTASSTSYSGGAIFAYSGTLNLFAVSFFSNTAASNNGDDVYTVSAPVTIHDTCPDGEGGAPKEGQSSTMPTCSSPLSHQSNPSPLAFCIFTPSPQDPPLTQP